MNEDNETTQFVLPKTTTTESLDKSRKFPVLTSLVIISGLLLALFSTLLFPKILILFGNQTEPINKVIPLPDVTNTTSSLDKFKALSLEAKHIYVWDSTNQSVLYEKNSEERWPLASITKLMTTLVSYEIVDDDTLVSISKAAANQESGGYFREGETFKAKKLADFALVSSFNSAAYALADAVGSKLGDKDPVTLFVTAMNIRAKELGLNSLQFNNPTGLDVSTTLAGSYGSAKDVSLLVDYIHKNYPEILLPTINSQARLYNTAGEYHDGNNTNDIITDIPNVLGSKTGYTDLAGGNLTIIFDSGYNHYIVITLLGSTLNGRFSDMKKIIGVLTDNAK